MGSASSAGRVCVSCRVTRLSRYNSEPLCGACRQAAKDASPIVPTWLWDSVPMRSALARADIAAVVAVLRAAAGLTQEDLALLVNRSQATISRTELGQRATLYDIRELLDFVDTLGMPRPALLPLILSTPNSTLEADNSVEPHDGMDVDRRSFNEMAAGLLTGALLPMAELPERADLAHVRYLRSCLHKIRSGYQSAGGGTVAAQAQRHFGWARRLVDDCDYTDTVGRQLIAVTAELGEAAGWSAYDRDDQQLARYLYSEAELLAGSCDDPMVRAHIYTDMAQQSIYLARTTGRRGVAREALRLTARAAEVARHEPSPRLHALIALREAIAHAELGDALGFRTAINRARREIDRGSHPTDPAWATFVTPSEITGFEAGGYEALGRHQDGGVEQAVELYRQVLGDPDRSARDRVYYRARLARVLLELGDVRQAVEEGTQVLPSISGVASARSLMELRPLRRAAEPAAEEFCIQFDEALQALPA
jgi:transcriptional regulator with XRE-family HTH domain